MAGIYSVSQVNSYIKNMFAQDFALSRISVRGEVSNCKYHTSGHIYFTLKDKTGTLAAVMFAGQRRGLSFQLQEGQQVVVTGTVDVYERDGKYQLYARKIEQDGQGDLFLRFQKLRDQLEEMGMFAPEYKQPIPRYAKRIGVVTAPTGAAIQDIRNIAGRRNPYVQLILCPALVQGEGAKESIVRGIQTLDQLGLDVLIVGRGGGSIEDLWAFNEECVARAIFQCRTPVISAVGHETDVTIADFAADLRAPTPSAAAELAVCDVRELLGRLEDYEDRFRKSMEMQMERFRQRLRQYQMRLMYVSPGQRIRENRQYLADTEGRLRLLMEQKIRDRRHCLQIYIERFRGLSPLEKLNQGFSYVEDEKGKAVTVVGEVEKGDLLTIQVTDGRIRARVEEAEKTEGEAER